MSGNSSHHRHKNSRLREHERGRRLPSSIQIERQIKHPARGQHRQSYRDEQGSSSRSHDIPSSSRGHQRPLSKFKRHNKNFLSETDILLLARSPPDRVVACVNENEFGFLEAYKNKHFCDDREILKQLVKILHLLIQVDDIERIARRTLARIFSSDAKYASFLGKTEQLIRRIGREKIRQDNVQYLDHLAEIGIKMMSILPKTSREVFPFFSLKESVEDLGTKVKVHRALDDNMKELISLYEQPNKFSGGSSTVLSSLSLEHDIRILPGLDELLFTDPAIQPNRIKGPYQDWTHYLDVHYSLMREDFLIPFRNGVRHFQCRTEHNKKEENLYIYKNVKIQDPVCLCTGVGFQVRFDASKLNSIQWDHSKRLMFGSLLCLSSDNFESSVMFASVMKRDPKLLKEGFVVIKFEEKVSKLQLSFQDTFTMVESMAYYEAYRHTLCKLQDMSLSVETLPFKQYIVDCDMKYIPPPSYACVRGKLVFDLSSVLGSKTSVILNEPTSWPPFSSTCLDESQMKALYQALNKEISVIQGPPGTGKTFLGLKVVEAYLRNRSVWDINNEAPILVICYTNHALDQFLEGIQKIKLAGKKPNIIRIGGRCKSLQLSESVLKNKVESYRDSHEFSRPLLRKLNDAHIGMTETKNEIYTSVFVSDSQDNHWRSLSELKHAMLRSHFESLKKLNVPENKKIQEWFERSQSSAPKSNYVAPSRGDARKYIEVESDAKKVEEQRITDADEIDFIDCRPFMSNTCGSSDDYVTQQVGLTKRRKVEKDKLHYKSMTTEEMCQVNDIFSLTRQQKWELYNYWIKQLSMKDLDVVRKSIDQYEHYCQEYSDCRRNIDTEVLFGTDVIGMTTTGAAKHHHILQKIHPKIVIFEEAAEIFESHVITSLPPSVQQLILIGDHQQLRPKPNSYKLEVECNLGVSMFERLVKNGMEYVTLKVQHRMRPEISSLIHPCIYPDLSDHVSVMQHENIRGIAENVFMITHSHEEKTMENNEKTHVNEFEADFIVALCHYLLKQGYTPSQITILTMYRGQLFEFKQRMIRETFDGVRVTVVDDFQGEENDIILLSLVRSNPSKKIGFIEASNRICVSLSRAKLGLYIVGNADMLRDKTKTVWPKVIEEFEQRNCLHDSLPLYCQVHKDTKVWAKTPEDFDKCPEGGCDKKCGTRLACGHACPKMCHPKDMNHVSYKCMKRCSRTLPCQHSCKRKCWECKKGCLPCTQQVQKVIPKCGHTVSISCSEDPQLQCCKLPCKKTLSCGHSCKKECSQPCTVTCYEKTKKKLCCGHFKEGVCSKVLQCSEPCTALLDCEHRCSGTCGDCHMGRMHKRCSEPCGRPNFCGHKCKFPCASNCPPCTEPCKNFCVHSKCPKKCYEPCTPCMEPCEWKCKHLECTKRCGEICDRQPCDKPCEKILVCGHPCIGLCGEKCPSLCRVCNKDEVCEIFFGTEDEENARFLELEDCSHVLEVSGLDTFVQGTNDGSVKFSECPKCRTLIRTSLRYCNKVKETLQDAETIKQKYIQQQSSMKDEFISLKSSGKCLDFVQEEMSTLASNIDQQEFLHPWRINDILVQINIYRTITKVVETLSGISRSTANNLKSKFPVCDISLIRKDLVDLKSFVSQEFLSKQQVTDATCEARRLLCAANLCQLLCQLSDPKHLSGKHLANIENCIKIVQESGWTQERLFEAKESEISNIIEDIEKAYGVGHLTEKERVAIVKAINLEPGHWYKCPNGHIYCIGECGGAMQKSKCPECGQVIGGQSHQLATGNAHAPEMDGSRHAAWSEGANLENFDLRNLH